MSSRFVNKIVGIAALGLTLGGCNDLYTARRDTISVVSGDALATNRVTHMIDPWSAASGRRTIAYNGQKAQTASERYRTGRVITPVPASTSSTYGATQQSQQPTAGSSDGGGGGSAGGASK
jgi:hypothetical protein